MTRSKQGSTLILALLLFAFVLLLGTGAVMMASVSSNQTSITLGTRQADYSAKSVLDAVFAKIEAGEIHPEKLAPNAAINGSGADAVLGDYSFAIKAYSDGKGTENLYKISVEATYAKITSQVYSIIQWFPGTGTGGTQELKLSVLGTTTANPTVGNALSGAKIEGSLNLNNAGNILMLNNGGYVSDNIDIIGGLELTAFNVGTKDKNNMIQATNNVTVTGGSTVYASIRSEQNVLFISGTATGDVYANGNVTVSGGFALNGDIHTVGNAIIPNGNITGDIYANGNVTISNGAVHGNIYTNGDVTLSGGFHLYGNIFANGKVTITNNLTVEGSVASNGNVLITQGIIKGNVTTNGTADLTGSVTGTVIAVGDVQILQCANIKAISSNGSVYFYNNSGVNAVTANTFASGNIIVGQNKSGSASVCTITGSLNAAGNITIYASTTGNMNATGNITMNGATINGTTLAKDIIAYKSAINGAMQAVGDIVLDQQSVQKNGTITANAHITVTNGSTFSSNVYAGGNFYLYSDATGNVIIGGNATISNATLTGSLAARGNGVFIGKGNTVNPVTGTITLGGTLDTSSTPWGQVKKITVEHVDPNSIILAAPISSFVLAAPVTPITKPTLEPLEPLLELKWITDAPDWKIPADIQAELAKSVIELKLSAAGGSATGSTNYTINGNEHTVTGNSTITITPGSNTWGKRIVFDTTVQDKDLYILLQSAGGSGSTVTIPSGVYILSKGEHNVYVFLDDGAGNYVNLTAMGNQFFGYYGYSSSIPGTGARVPNLFFICNAAGETIKFNQYGTFYCYIYAPKAYVDLSTGSSMFGPRFSGTVTASRINLTTSSKFVQKTTTVQIESSGSAGATGSWATLKTYMGTGEE